MPNPNLILSARHVSKQVQTPTRVLEILRDVNCEIHRGESVAISGPSGSGKTTLLSLLTGLDTPTAGEIFFADRKISAMNEDDRARLRAEFVGIVFQTFQLLPTLTTLENVLLPLELSGKQQALDLAMHWLTKVGLENRLEHFPAQLSGGEQQRVAIARAFAVEPQVLFADEPTGNLDTATGESIINLLLSLNQERGTTLIVVTHDQELAQRCQRTIELRAGTLV